MKTVLLKISGELFTSTNTQFNMQLIDSIIMQIIELRKNIKFGFVIGGGNFFRGLHQGKDLKLRQATADMVGMLGTVMNGVMLQEFFEKAGIKTRLLSALEIPEAAEPVRQTLIDDALAKNDCLIFAGGTGLPYFSTDTTAIIRALQIGAHEVWKATKVDYVYSDDPMINASAEPLKTLTYQEAVERNLKVMDKSALVLAHDHAVLLRVFNLFSKNSLINVAQDKNFGSTITT
jgi:uridylate kinase